MGGKRTTSVTVKMTKDDHALLMEAATAHWPGAIMSSSSILLSLAKLGAEQILKTKKSK